MTTMSRRNAFGVMGAVAASAMVAPLVLFHSRAARGEPVLGAGFGKLFKIGSQPINSRILAFYNVERPAGAPDWALKFTIQLLFPK